MQTREAAKGRWSEIYQYYGISLTGKRHFKGECFLCGRENSLRIDDKTGIGDWICVCDSGDGFKLLNLVTGKGYGDLMKEVDVIIGNTFTNESIPVSDVDVYRNKLMSSYKNLPLPGEVNDAGLYLANRGIKSMPEYSVRFGVNLKGNDALVSIVSDENNIPCYSHVTYIKDGKKASVDVPKVMKSMQNDSVLMQARSLAIRMFRAGKTLGIAEGIETALSARDRFGIPVWSVVNAGFMRKFLAPIGVEKLVIYADNDYSGTGLAAAFDCANKNHMNRKNTTLKEIEVIWLDEIGDFNDNELTETRNHILRR